MQRYRRRHLIASNIIPFECNVSSNIDVESATGTSRPIVIIADDSSVTDRINRKFERIEPTDDVSAGSVTAARANKTHVGFSIFFFFRGKNRSHPFDN